MGFWQWLGSVLKRGPDVWAPTHRHKKGGLYRVTGRGVLEADLSAVVIYDDAAGQIWVRPVSEFDDGRFTEIDQSSR